ncbi:MAG: hypothetical protein A3E88_05305 [Legionellales bacterium RIFCSPHIGHO2_12_FULL_35_11]|nr:MAG: hypothetical protein A3E88_05305 [Legionellales bacterium RIFCSPHIGHO2_12_FULL_35_11]
MAVKRGFLFIISLMFSVNIFASTLNKIVVFGDSLSDTGNLYEYFKHQLPPSPPYYQGRFSNGPVWVEIVAKNYYPKDPALHLQDFAFGGAGVSYDRNSEDDGEEGVMFTLSREIESYLLANQDKADKKSLFAVWIGSNNYIASYATPMQTAADVNKSIRKSLELLAEKGARNILVINIPDMGRSPAARMIYAQKELSLASQLHNEDLAKNINELKQAYPQVRWLLYDANADFAKTLADPAKYGYTNITDTCYQSILDNIASPKLVLAMAAAAKPTVNDACDGYFFFDPVHPSAKTHEIMATNVTKFLIKSGVKFG